MNDHYSEETRSFRDPMAPRMEAAQKRRDALNEKYPQAATVYDGFYLRLHSLGEEGNRFFLGTEGSIGSELHFDKETGLLLTSDGRQLAQVPGETAERLITYSAANWHIKPLVSTILLRARDKSASAEIAFICWAPLEEAYDKALATFSLNIAHRLASGDRASLVLSQEQFISVLRSNGSWFLTPTTKRTPPEKGTVVYKARRSGVERLTGFALRHRLGCTVLATLFWLLVVASLVALIGSLFFW